jgi:tRNA G18 (ribose-2'-O)-methylase SpoU
MLKFNLRNFSNSTCFWLRQVPQRSQELSKEPIILAKESDVPIDKEVKVIKKPEIKITKLKKNDRTLAQLVTLLRTRKKHHDNQIIIEGNQLIKEAIEARIKLNKIIFANIEKLDLIKPLIQTKNMLKNLEVFKVPTSDLAVYSVLTTCPGLIGIFDKPSEIEPKSNALDIKIIADNVREPNNLGALIRVSSAIPVNSMILPKGSVDPWDTKTIRGSCGSVFHLPINQTDWNSIHDSMSDNKNILVLIADHNVKRYEWKKVMDYDKIPAELVEDKEIFLIIGGENQGISSEAFEFAKHHDYRIINIPIQKDINSLNVSTALGIILFELRRMLRTKI